MSAPWLLPLVHEIQCVVRYPWHARDYWARFERFVKQLTQQCEDVYVLTGPLYLPQRTPQGYMMHHPMIGAPHSCFL